MNRFHILIIISALLMLAGASQRLSAEGYEMPPKTCTAQITYTIFADDGTVNDQTVYDQSWPGILCTQHVKWKYIKMGSMVESGQREFRQVTGEAE